MLFLDCIFHNIAKTALCSQNHLLVFSCTERQSLDILLCRGLKGFTPSVH